MDTWEVGKAIKSQVLRQLKDSSEMSSRMLGPTINPFKGTFFTAA